MNDQAQPPFLARALLFVMSPAADFESVSGDLHEEYGLRFSYMRRWAADRWYWSQTLRSVPALLSYSRKRISLGVLSRNIVAGVVVVFAMLFCKDVIDRAIVMFDPLQLGIPAWLYCGVDFSDAVIFGSLLSLLVGADSVRVTFFTALVLIAVLGLPSFFGMSAPLVQEAWVLLLGTPPAMTAGAVIAQILRYRCVAGHDSAHLRGIERDAPGFRR